MKKILLLALVALLAMPAVAQEKTAAYDSFVQVTGKAEKSITPDKFTLSITIDESDTKGKIPVALQRKEMFGALKKLGIDLDKQLQIADLSSDYFKRGNSLAAEAYTLTLNDKSKVVEVYSTLGELGISNVSLKSYTHSQIDSFKDELRAVAVLDAKAKAELLATTLGQSVGKCFYIRDYDYNGGDVVVVAFGSTRKAAFTGSANALAESNAVASELDFKPIELKISIDAKFLLE